MKGIWWVFAVVLALALPAAGQDLSALARLDPARSGITEAGDEALVTLGLSQPVPWRVRVLASPPRLVMDFREVDWTGIETVPREGGAILGLRAGVFRPGWSRLVMDLAGPMLVEEAGMATGGAADGAATVTLRLVPASAEDFAAKAAEPEPESWALPDAAEAAVAAPRGKGPLIVVLDPGHGGIDPGAERGGTTEAKLMLIFARQLKEVLLRDGNFRVALTREQDEFVPLETRISIAHGLGAQVFISLHADALPEGQAVGATVYTLAAEASDAASAALAERHDRDDLLAGVDLSQQDDLVAEVLMDMARAETAPRTQRLAGALVEAIREAGVKMHRHPHQEAAFSVLKSADIPSVLVELGFLSSESDLARLEDRVWRQKMAEAIRDGLKLWAADDAARAGVGD